MRRKLILAALLILVPVLILAGRGDVKQSRETFTLTTSVQAGWSSTVDTFPLFPMYRDGYDALWGRIILHPSATTTHGLGLADSCWLQIYADGGGDWLLISSDTCEGLGCTSYFAAVESDTLFRDMLYLVVTVADSTGDMVLSADYDLDRYFIRKD